MWFLKQSTAITIPMGPFVSKADGFTTMDALSSQTGKIVKNGATGTTFTPSSWTSDGNGHYLVGLSTTHTNTLGTCRFTFADANNYIPVFEDAIVLVAAVFDALFGDGTSYIRADLRQSGGTTVPAGAIPNAAAGANGGLPTVNASNFVAGLQGTINNLNNLDAAISTRAPLSTALSTTQWTNTRATNLDNLDATVSSRSTFSPTSGTLAELTVAAPPTNPTMAQAVMLMYMALRNAVTTTATAQQIKNDAGTSICSATLSDDGTTFTKSKFV